MTPDENLPFLPDQSVKHRKYTNLLKNTEHILLDVTSESKHVDDFDHLSNTTAPSSQIAKIEKKSEEYLTKFDHRND